MTIVGTYDAFFIPILLEKSLVSSLLPDSLKTGDGTSGLCDATAVGQILGSRVNIPDNKHPIVFVLGRENGCGLSILPKMNFQVHIRHAVFCS
jgi:hypothetical protein